MRLPLLIALLVLPALSRAQHSPETLEIEPGKQTSTELRKRDSYIEVIRVVRPQANTSAESLARINPSLPKLLKDFTRLIETAEVSSRFGEIYDRKIALMKQGSFPTEHNYLDCETVLRLKHPDSGRIALWLQADMDVVTDGSDPGRFPAISDYDLARSSDWYLPQTSYAWRMSDADARNPFLDYYPAAIRELESLREIVLEKKEGDAGVVWREVLDTVDDQIARLKYRGMKSHTRDGLEKRRYLVATKDPFVVLPVHWVNKSALWSPQIGDYAAVIYQDRIYPAILGDAGPSDKVGEASLRIARGLNPKADGGNRAVSDLTVTYLFFPRSASPRATPDHALWRKEVASLLDELAGISSPDALHDWDAE